MENKNGGKNGPIEKGSLSHKEDKEKNSPQKEFLERRRIPKKAAGQEKTKGSAPSQQGKKKKEPDEKEIAKAGEPPVERAKERLTGHKNLGPSGQQWDV
jgi:hypothetical protein